MLQVPKGETKLTIQGLDMKSYWDSKLKECVHDLNAEYQNTVELMRTEIENRYAMQVRVSLVSDVHMFKPE